MKKSFALNILLILITIIIGTLVYRMNITRLENPEWLVMPGMFLIINYVKEIKRALRKEKSSWSELTIQDKLIFGIGITLLFILLFLPLAAGLATGVFIVSIIIGLFVIWAMDKLGSTALRDFLYWS